MRFSGFGASFLGNKEIKQLLSAQIDGGQFPHAILLEGLPGSGRRTLAKWIATAAVCLADKGLDKPCGICAGCHKAAGDSHPDIQIHGGSTAARSFHIETIRAIQQEAYLLPNEAPRRVLILAEAQAMSEQAQNALLKILEEPPAHVIFILTCENRNQLLPTIQSRALCLTLSGVEEQEALPYLKQRLPQVAEEELRQALTVYGGRIGQVLAAMQDDSFADIQQLAKEIAVAVTAPQEWPLMQLTGVLAKQKDWVDGVLSALLLIYRDALAGRAGFSAGLSGQLSSADVIDTIASALTGAQMMAVIAAIQQLQRERLHYINHTLLITLLCSRLRAAAGRG